MINPEFAQNFVSKIHRQLNINVNIMNEKGIIIASSIQERIGSFHIVAYEIIQEKLPMLVTEKTEKDLIGVNSPGVNLLLQDGIEAIGVVGVSGSPHDSIPLARMVKFALESMLEYENKRSSLLKSQKQSSKFANALLLERPQNPARILKIAERMGFKDNYLRIPLLFCLSGENIGELGDRLADACYNLSCYHNQDILLPIDTQHILLLKAMEHRDEGLYRDFIVEYVNELDSIIKVEKTGEQIKHICGIPQTSFLQYGKVYENMSWLEKNRKYSNDKLNFLADYILEFMTESLSDESLAPFFDSYYALIKEHLDDDMFYTTLEALINANMKPKLAAENLYMHKNTIIVRLEKIKKILGLNPISNIKDAILLIAIHNYLKKRR